jgi:magnesium-transporting ATPase (P-type)
MSSVDKSLAIEFYKKYDKDNYICSIGECHSDMDSLLASNIGISFKNPNNRNMITSHFYSSKHNIFCIKQIIFEGKVFYENNLLLKKFSFVCTAIIDCYIYCCFIRNTVVIEKQLNFLEIEFLLLSVISFTGKAKKDIILEPLLKDGKLLDIYYLVQQIVLLLLKFVSVYLLYALYESDILLKQNIDLIFVTYYFILSIEFIICIIYSFKFISFYTISPFANFLLTLSTLLILLYMIILICLNSSNYKYDFLYMTIFEFSEVLMDSFSDKNRQILLMSCLIDFIISIIASTIVYYIFDQIAKYKLKKKSEKETYI